MLPCWCNWLVRSARVWSELMVWLVVIIQHYAMPQKTKELKKKWQRVYILGWPNGQQNKFLGTQNQNILHYYLQSLYWKSENIVQPSMNVKGLTMWVWNRFFHLHINISLLPVILQQAECSGFTVCGTKLNSFLPFLISSLYLHDLTSLESIQT
jgi:hypothetical protein